MNLLYEQERFKRIGREGAVAYLRIYRRAALDAKRKHGRNYPYRYGWIESAMSFRYLLRTQKQ